MILPDPTSFSDWRLWAKRLIATFNQPETTPILKLPTFAVTTLPKANEDAMVVWVLDDATGAQPAYSKSGAWYRFDGTLVT